jgi:hypothetical protein
MDEDEFQIDEVELPESELDDFSYGDDPDDFDEEPSEDEE